MMESLQIQNKHPIGLKDDLIRFLRSKVKVTVNPHLVNSLSQENLGEAISNLAQTSTWMSWNFEVEGFGHNSGIHLVIMTKFHTNVC